MWLESYKLFFFKSLLKHSGLYAFGRGKENRILCKSAVVNFFKKKLNLMQWWTICFDLYNAKGVPNTRLILLYCFIIRVASSVFECIRYSTTKPFVSFLHSHPVKLINREHGVYNISGSELSEQASLIILSLLLLGVESSQSINLLSVYLIVFIPNFVQ